MNQNLNQTTIIVRPYKSSDEKNLNPKKYYYQ